MVKGSTRPKPKLKRAEPVASGGRMVQPALAGLFTVALVAGLLLGLARLGDAARNRLGWRERYVVWFADIQCDAPPGMTRENFLIEVRYAASAPATFQSIEPTLSDQLAAAFAKHPWVERVEGVVVEPPKVVTVRLKFRKPVLVVSTEAGRRTVDAKGIVLPLTAPTNDLPELLTPVAVPPGRAGQPWPDAEVIRAAAIAAEYGPRTLERTEQGFLLIQPSGQRLVVGR